MKSPDAKRYNPDPRYLRELIAQAGVTQAEAARRLGITARMMRHYVSLTKGYDCPYSIQYGLEALAKSKTAKS